MLMQTKPNAPRVASQTVFTETHQGWAIEVSRRRTGFTIVRQMFHVSVRNETEAGAYFHGFHSVTMAVETARRFIRQHAERQVVLKQVRRLRKHARTSRSAA